MSREPIDSLMMRVLLGPLVTALQLFACYVLLHGHYSPGGGFQAGVLLAASFILPLLVHGHHVRSHGLLTMSEDQAVKLAAFGVLAFCAIGAAPMLGGQALLDYGVLPLPMEVADRRSLGILGIELGVMLAVAGAVVAIYRSLQEHELDEPPLES